MHDALNDLLDNADRAISAAVKVVDAELLSAIAITVANARTRLSYPEQVLVVALAGGTGSGKSSLFGALTGTDEAMVGVTRPTTSEAMAALPARFGPAMIGYLDEIGVTRHITQGLRPGLCLIDLPDTDSIEHSHRYRVEELLPRIDVIVWVVDPEKYRDAALHNRYLSPLADYASQFVVALNQSDRLSEAAVAKVSADLRAALVDDGVVGVPVVATAADPVSGPPMGIDELADLLATMSVRPDLVYSKLLTDLDRAAADLVEAIGLPIGYREEADRVIDLLTRQLAGDANNAAIESFIDFLDWLEPSLHGEAKNRLEYERANAAETVHDLATLIPPMPKRRRWGMGARTESRESSARTVAIEILEPMTQVVADRARAVAAATELSVAVAGVRRRSVT